MNENSSAGGSDDVVFRKLGQRTFCRSLSINTENIHLLPRGRKDKKRDRDGERETDREREKTGGEQETSIYLGCAEDKAMEKGARDPASWH